jgi:hypothetical protein
VKICPDGLLISEKNRSNRMPPVPTPILCLSTPLFQKKTVIPLSSALSVTPPLSYLLLYLSSLFLPFRTLLADNFSGPPYNFMIDGLSPLLAGNFTIFSIPILMSE